MKYLFISLSVFVLSFSNGYCELTSDQARYIIGNCGEDRLISVSLRKNKNILKEVHLDDGSSIEVSSAEGFFKMNKIFPIGGENYSGLEDRNIPTSSASARISNIDGTYSGGFSDCVIELSGDARMGGETKVYNGNGFINIDEYHIRFPSPFLPGVGGSSADIVGNGVAYAARIMGYEARDSGRLDTSKLKLVTGIFVWGDPDHRPRNLSLPLNKEDDSSWVGEFLALPEGKEVVSIIYFDLTELVVLCGDGSLCFWSINKEGSWDRGVIPIETHGRKIVAINSWQPEGWHYGIDELMFGLHITFDNKEEEDWTHVRTISLGDSFPHYKITIDSNEGWKKQKPKPFPLVQVSYEGLLIDSDGMLY
ncbi:MAG: hypothetical protein ACOYK6_00210 [Chthoniobacterales bacterium]